MLEPIPLIEDLPLYDLQNEAALLLARERGGVAWWRVGQGKTRLALAAFCHFLRSRRETDETSQLLIFSRSEAFYDWQQEANLLNIGTRILLRSAGMLSTQSSEQIVLDVLNNPRIVMVCFDELYLYKNPDSLKGKAAHAISKFKPSIGLSGSIMPAKRIEDVYGQAKALNKHRRIAPNMTKFREEFMNGINQFGGMMYHPKRGAYDALMARCVGEDGFAHIHMPLKSSRKITESIINVDETSQQHELFQQIQELMALPDFGVELTNSANLIQKVQQLANGWIEDDQGTYHAISTNKLAACVAKCEELASAGERVVVWCAFRHDVAMLSHLYRDTHSTMLGGKPFDVAFWNGKERPMVCFATEASGSSVNHFKDCAYAIYFSMSIRGLDYQQSQGRTDRKDSAHTECFYYHFHCANSMDEAILRRVRQAVSAEAAMLRLGQDMQVWLRGGPEKES